MTIHACTIIARNYLAAARVLARSFTEHHPDGTFTALVIDDLREQVDGRLEPFEILRPEDLSLEPSEVNRFAAMYDVMEFATSLKPWLLERLLLRWNEEVIYLDPDIVVYAPLTELTELAREVEVVLTPHVTSPIERDGLMIDETHILASGIFNLGFVAVGASSRGFLEFWKERLSRECVIDPLRMRFVDQRWLDFVPGMFDVSIVRDPGYNVAYWNLCGRDLAWEGDRYTVDGRPLRFFHFSGYSPKEPTLLSRHQGGRPRVLLSEHPVVAKICAEYAASLRAAGLVDEGTPPSYGYSRLENGLKFDRPMRAVYREALQKAEKNGIALPPNPFEDVAGFMGWLNAPVMSGHLSRYLMTLWSHTPDLQKRFPSAEYRDREAFLEWCTSESDVARIDFRLVPEWITKPNHALLDSEVVACEPGFRIVREHTDGATAAELGQSAVAAVQASGAPHAVWTDYTDRSPDGEDLPEPSRRQESAFNVNLICVGPSEMADFAWRMGPEFFRDHYTVALWDWALEVFPDQYESAFEHVDEVWTASTFARESIVSHSTKPVLTFPVPVIAPTQRGNLDDLDLPASPRFLCSLDMAEVFERANPLGLIEAFARAFPSGQGPTLMFEVRNGESNVANLERLRMAASTRPDVLVLNTESHGPADGELLAACDCYVSLHRSEGFGLMSARAMALGKPVIATAYSGNLDYMDDETSYLVPYKYTSVPGDCAPYPRGARWAEPDLDRAAELLCRVSDFPAEAEAVGERARLRIGELCSPTAAATFVSARLDAAHLALAERLWVLS